MNKEATEAKLQKEFDWYEKQTDQVARRMFIEHVKPLCRKKGWIFSAGMGAWWMGPPDLASLERQRFCGHFEEGGDYEEIGNLLNMEVPGFPVNYFGSFMPSYPEKEEDRERGGT